MKTDYVMGVRVHDKLLHLGIETPAFFKEPDPSKLKTVTALMEKVLSELGCDLKDDSMQNSPKRIAKMYVEELFTGLDYHSFPECTTFENKGQYNELVTCDDITVQSVCEHHFVPFVGKAVVAFIPGKKMIGLSKINRLVQFFCRRPQIQERLTEQVCVALATVLDIQDVAVVIRAKHMCVALRGCRDTGSETVTSRMMGKFRTVPELRAEFLNLTHINK